VLPGIRFGGGSNGSAAPIQQADIRDPSSWSVCAKGSTPSPTWRRSSSPTIPCLRRGEPRRHLQRGRSGEDVERPPLHLRVVRMVTTRDHGVSASKLAAEEIVIRERSFEHNDRPPDAGLRRERWLELTMS